MRHHDDVPGIVLLGSDFKALGYMRSLGRRGIASIVIDNQPRAAWFSRYAMGRFRWHTSMEDPELVAFLLHLSRLHHLDNWLLVPAQDEVVGLVARHRQSLSSVFRVVTPPWDIVRWALDKRLTDRMAHDLAVPYPRTWYPASVDDLPESRGVLPAIIKPAISVHLQYATRLKALPAHSARALREQYAFAAGLLPADEIMIQEIIPGDGTHQWSLAAYCVDGEVLCHMTARRTRQYPVDFGLSSSFVEAIAEPALLAPAQRILRFMRLTGMVELEFKYDRRDATFKLLDVNVRPWGWHTLCIACGLDFPYLQYRHVLGERPVVGMPRYGPRWLRALTDVPAGLRELHQHSLSPGAYVRSLLAPTVFSVLDWRDPLPTVGDAGAAFLRALSWRGPHNPRATFDQHRQDSSHSTSQPRGPSHQGELSTPRHAPGSS